MSLTEGNELSPRTENLIHSARAKLDLTNQEAATAMSAILEKPISKETAGHYFTGTSGVPISNLGAFLGALGLKVVPDEQPEITNEKLAALKVLAREALAEE